MKDDKGNVISSSLALKQLYMNVYTDRLTPVTCNVNEMNEVHLLKEEVFNIRKQVSDTRKSQAWTKKDLEMLNL